MLLLHEETTELNFTYNEQFLDDRLFFELDGFFELNPLLKNVLIKANLKEFTTRRSHSNLEKSFNTNFLLK